MRNIFFAAFSYFVDKSSIYVSLEMQFFHKEDESELDSRI